MDEDVKRDDGTKVGGNLYPSGRASMAARASARTEGGPAARSLATPERKGIGGSQAGTGNGSSKEDNAANIAIAARGTQDIAPDTETPSRGTKAPVVFRQVTVEKPGPATAPPKEPWPTGLSNGTDAKKTAAKETAESAADNLDATRLLKPEQLARAFSAPPKDRADAGVASTQAAKPQPNPASSGEDDWPQFRGSLPRIARDDESTQYFQLSVPKNGPIRAEPADNRVQADRPSNPAVSGPVSRNPVSQNMDRLQAARAPSLSAESNTYSDKGAPGAVQQNIPAPHPTPQSAQGSLQTLVPGLVMLNLLLTLLSLAANACLAFHILTTGR